MGFFSPWFLVGMVGIGLPVYVHLLRRHTTPPQPFSSLMFFERGIQSSTRHRRLRYLLLFSLRTALLLLLVLAFANPFIRRAAAGASGKLLLVVVDDSFSMRAGSRFADAKQGALQVLASRPRSQRAEVMALGGRLAVLTQPIQDAAALRSAVESIQPGDSRANLGELAHGVRALVESVRMPVELHLFSDMQKTGMPANFADMELPPNVSVVLHPAGKIVPNWTVESINAPAQLADPKDPKKSRVQAVIAGYGTPAASRTVSLVVNGNTIATRKVEIPADGRATVEFQPLDVPYGLNRCAVKIDSADGFPADDISVFAVKRADPERVLFVHQASDSRSPVYFGAALAAASQASFTLQSIDNEKSTDIDPSKYAFVVLSDAMALPSIFENALLQYVRGGGSVLIAAGTSAAHHARIPIFGGYSSDAHSYSRDGYAVVGETDFTHPVMNETTVASNDPATNAMTAKDAAGWSDLKFYYVAGVDAPQARVIARLTDRRPLLMEKQIGEGHVLLLASGLDDLTNDFPVRPAFVPFIDRTARYLSGSDRIGSRLVDSFVPLRTAAAQAGNPAAGVEIIGPDGHRALSLTEAASTQSFQLARAGFYQIRFANGKNALIGVNPDRRESDLAPIPDDLLQLWGKSLAESAPARSAAPDSSQEKNSHSIWWYVMLLVLVAAVAESIVASRYLGTQREEA
jgi:Aerotolerance regulator N-terminal/von Willebrand factor type A domain